MNPPVRPWAAAPNSREEIFCAALELPAAVRTAYLDRVCGADGPERLALVKLLLAHEKAQRVFAMPIGKAEAVAVGAP